jgi:NitT/TauT family transport system substrate-binding protein
MRRCEPRQTLVAVLAVAGLGLAACGSEPSAAKTSGTDPSRAGGGPVHLTVGYQSKTINTVTAGTLLRDLGILERRLGQLSKKSGRQYSLEWQDYPSGPPITAQMLAGKVDIASMGDYPMLVNGSKTKGIADARTRMLAITGYNRLGSLNAIVVPLSSKARRLEDLKGETVSATLGSAGHGMAVRALGNIGKGPDFVRFVQQQPEVGASALEGGQVAALAQYVPWPEVMIYRGKARKLFDGGANKYPTMHGVIARQAYAAQHPEVVETFLAAVLEATTYIHEHPLDSAERVGKATGIEPEVAYLVNGPNGVVNFDPTIKPELVAALRSDIPFLKTLDTVTDLDLNAFIDDTYLRKVYGPNYETARDSFANQSRITGHDDICGLDVSDPAAASEAWFAGSEQTEVAATPTCLLRLVRAQEGAGATLRAGYVPDARTATRNLARRASWVLDPSAPEVSRLLPFATLGDAEDHVSGHPGTKLVTYAEALAAA